MAVLEKLLQPLTALVGRAADLGFGGLVLIALLCLSVIALSIICWKLLEPLFQRFYARGRVEEALSHWEAGNRDMALGTIQLSRAVVPRLLGYTFSLLDRHGADAEWVAEDVQRHANAVVHDRRRMLRALDVIGSVAPLLGLFGTVLGMIEAFRQLEAAGQQVDPSVLSGGIWQALLTTGVGLAVAIPAVLFFNWFDQRAANQTRYLETTLTRAFTAVQRQTVSVSRGLDVDFDESAQRLPKPDSL